MLLYPNVFFVLSFVVGSFRYPCDLISILFVQFLRWVKSNSALMTVASNMAKKAKKILDSLKTKRHSPGGQGKSNHEGDKIGLFTANAMIAYIAKIKEVEGEAR